jgi:hypothetical protein
MKNLINRIEELEDKRDNGTITMEEEIVFLRLVELAENFLSK